MVPETDDHEWLDRIWERYSGPVFAYAARRVGRDRAEDVVADTFVVAWRHRESRPGRDLPWLLAVARRVIGERYRAEERWQRLQARAARTPRPPILPMPRGRWPPGKCWPASTKAGARSLAALRLGRPLQQRGRCRPWQPAPAAYRMRLARSRAAPAPVHGRGRAHRPARPGGLR